MAGFTHPERNRTGVKFWKRWIADIRAKTVGCSLAELGAYDRLLDEYYMHENPLPPDHDSLYRICSAMTSAERKAVDKVVAAFFFEQDGRLHNKRGDEYLEQELGIRKEQSEKGREGARKRWQKPPAKARANGKHPPAPDEAFAAFWAAYPRKVGKADALKAWAKLAPGDELHSVIIRAVLAQSAGPDWRKEGGRYIPHPASWLNARRWEDEAAPPPPRQVAI